MSPQTNTTDEVQRSAMDRVVALYSKRVGNDPSNAGLLGKIYDFVVQKICSNEWPPGTKLVETRVAAELGISHVPVREAMERLSQNGWIERIPNRGAFVRTPDLKTINDLFQIREMVETGAVRILAESITNEQIEELKSVSDLCESARQTNNKEIVENTDTHFHRLLVHFTGNSRLESMFEAILLQSRGTFFSNSRGFPFYAQQIHGHLQVANHPQICDSLISRDQIKAEQLVREHIRVGRVSAVKLWELFNEVSKGNSGKHLKGKFNIS